MPMTFRVVARMPETDFCAAPALLALKELTDSPANAQVDTEIPLKYQQCIIFITVIGFHHRVADNGQVSKEIAIRTVTDEDVPETIVVRKVQCF